MAAITGGGVWTYTIVGLLHEQLTMTIQHLRDTSTGTIPDYAADAILLAQTQAAIGGWNDLYLECVTADFTIQEVLIQPVYPARMRAVKYLPAVVDGKIPGPTLPPNVAQTVTKYADGATRRDMGSMHLPAVPTAVHDSGYMLMGHVTKLQTLGQHLTDFWEAGQFNYTFRPILWSRSVPTTKRDITACRAHDTTRTVRRRTVRVGV